MSWARDLDLKRLSGPGPFLPASANSLLESLRSNKTTEVDFAIRPLESEELLGQIGLKDISWRNQHAELYIRVGRPHWGKGYGREAMDLLLRYAFMELNMHRIGLRVVDYNTRAITLYRKVGFQHEGTQRECGLRDQRRYNIECFGLLYPEWKELQSDTVDDDYDDF
ncbi:MAG: GNAT family N-acetyltransferase [Myxococcales bacterium]|nr:GNAT family N-acetyltransferase [Myxococcales bacterium]